MSLEVFWGSGSPFSWSVLLTLELKKLDYKSRLIEFSKNEHQTPEFLQMNPRGKVPVLKDGDFIIYESLAIMQYLDNLYPKNPLFGRTPKEIAKIMQRISEVTFYLGRPLDRFIRPLFLGEMEKKNLQIEEAATEIHQELAKLNSHLDQSPWLVGVQITAADIILIPLLELLIRVNKKNEAIAKFNFNNINDLYPHLNKWIKQMEELPAFKRSYPPHWK